MTWSSQNRSQLIRIPAANGKYSRVELRSPDPSCNPYLAFALLIYSGLDGIRNNLKLEKPADYDLYKAPGDLASKYKKLPATLYEAIENTEKGDFVRNWLPAEIVEKYIQIKREQWNRYMLSEDKEDFELNSYFLYGLIVTGGIMDNVLIVSDSDKGIELLTRLLKANGINKINSVKSGAEARRMIGEVESDLIVIITPLPDEFGESLAITATEISTSGVILITRSEIADEIEARVQDYGILVVSNPISRQVFYQAQKLALATRRRLSGLKNENMRLQNKIDEIRLVTRAKCVLIEYLNMTENQAHKYIEKQAMDLRTSRKEIAQSILKAYET